MAGLADDIAAAGEGSAAEGEISDKGFGGKEGKRRGDGAGEMVVGKVEILENMEGDAGNGARKGVGLEAEGEEMGKTVKRVRNRAGEIVEREVETVKAVEGGKRGGNWAGEGVVRKEKKLESSEGGDVWGNRAREGVRFEAEDAELIEEEDGREEGMGGGGE